MNFEITKTSDWDYKDTKTFDTLEELMKWIDGIIKEDIIINYETHEIEIYDSWRE